MKRLLLFYLLCKERLELILLGHTDGTNSNNWEERHVTLMRISSGYSYALWSHDIEFDPGNNVRRNLVTFQIGKIVGIAKGTTKPANKKKRE